MDWMMGIWRNASQHSGLPAGTRGGAKVASPACPLSSRLCSALATPFG
jgi:hypothetical protein